MRLRTIVWTSLLVITACASSDDGTDMQTDSTTSPDSGEADSDAGDDSCEPNPTDPTRFVVV